MIAFLRRIYSFARPYQARLILGMVCAVLFALSNAALVIAIKLAVNAVFPGSQPLSAEQQLQKLPGFLRPLADTLSSWLPAIKSPSSKAGEALIICAIPAVMLFRGLFSYLNTYCMYWASIRTVANLRTKLFGHLQNLSLDFYNSASTGDLSSRITRGTQVLFTIIGNTLASIIKDPLTIVCLLVVLLSDQPTLTFVSLVVLPVCIVPLVIYGRKVRASGRAMQTHAADLSTLMHEAFTAARIIKAYNFEEVMLAKFRSTTGKYVSQMMRALRASEMPRQVMEFVGSLGVASVFLYVIFLADNKTSGDFFSFIGSIFLMYQPIKSLASLHNQLEQARAASQRVFELLDAVSTVADPPNPKLLKATGAAIQFEHVDFAYGDKPILCGINLEVKPGQLVALVGHSGSGKTTVTNLLMRFFDPQGGAVKIGGTDIREVGIKDLRRQIALVAQETILFNDTVRNNLAMGRPGASDREIETAAKHAFAHQFIQERTTGYNTVVGEKGVALSGGQRQRLAIARALLKDAPILILDEALNALDTESERAVQEALDELMKGRTTICIAHRLSTIQKADLIVVLDQGRVVETGTHEELMKARGNYFRLYDLQFRSGNGTDS